MTLQTYLGAFASITAIGGMFPYIKDILTHKTKPHVFSWFIWSLLLGIGFFAQITDNAGPGAWVNGISCLLCLFTFIITIYIGGERQIVFLDKICFLCALIALVLWFITKTPVISVILIAMTDMFGYLPTFRKSFFKPFEETLSTYLFAGISMLLSLFALRNVSFITAFYPSVLVFINFTFITMLFVRRKQLSRV